MNLVESDDELIGFRTEAVVVGTQEDASDSSSWVTLSLKEAREEYLGSEKLIYGEVNGVRVVARTAASEPMPAIAGGEIPIAIARSSLRIFDKESGLRKQLTTPGISVHMSKEVSV